MISNIVKRFFRKQRSWIEVERFDERWRSRIKQMNSFIDDDDTSVVDLGCGPMWLKDYLKSSIKYIGVDYKKRGLNSYVCDLNSGSFPNISADVYFVSGCLEYIDIPDRLIKSIAKKTRHKCIVSYCCIDRFPDTAVRRMRGWKNHLTHSDVINLFADQRMALQINMLTDERNDIFVFSSASPDSQTSLCT